MNLETEIGLSNFIRQPRKGIEQKECKLHKYFTFHVKKVIGTKKKKVKEGLKMRTSGEGTELPK